MTCAMRWYAFQLATSAWSRHTTNVRSFGASARFMITTGMLICRRQRSVLEPSTDGGAPSFEPSSCTQPHTKNEP